MYCAMELLVLASDWRNDDAKLVPVSARAANKMIQGYLKGWGQLRIYYKNIIDLRILCSIHDSHTSVLKHRHSWI